MARYTPTEIPSLFVNPRGDYYYRGTPPGLKKRIERKLNGTTLSEAHRDLIRMMTRIEEDGQAIISRKVGPLLDKYLAYRKELMEFGELSARTIESDENTIEKYLRPAFAKVNAGDIDQFLFLKMCMRFGKKSYENHRKVLVTFLKWCKSQKIITQVPEFTLPKWEKRRRLVLTNDEITELIKNSHGNLLLYVSMYLLMGMRNKEICKLRWHFIDFEHQALHIARDTTKRGGVRDIPINPFVFDLLVAKRDRTKIQGEWVFPNKHRNGSTGHVSLQGFSKPWARLIARSAVRQELTPHDMRATFETFAHKMGGFTDTQLEKMAGSSIIVQRSTYVSLGAQDLRGLESAVSFDALNQVMQTKRGDIAGDESRGG